MSDTSKIYIHKFTEGWKLAIDTENKGKIQRWFENFPVSSAKDTPVPGIIQQVFPGYHGVVWYCHRFCPLISSGPNTRYIIRFGAVDYLADVWLNGTYIGSHEGGETPFTLDVTRVLKFDSENLLVVRVLNPIEEPIDGIVLKETPHRNKVNKNYRPGQSYNYGGIIQPVELLSIPLVRITDIFVKPDVNTGKIHINITIYNDMKDVVKGKLVASVGDKANGELLNTSEFTLKLMQGRTEHKIYLYVPQHHLWSTDDPYLYRVSVVLNATDKDGAIFIHEQSVRCGFRDFRIVDGYFLLNGKRIFLKSTHTVNHYPIGQILPPTSDLLNRDLIYAKASGFNMVRFIFGMAYPEQLDFCDEIGLMVYEESSAGWLLEDFPKMSERFDNSICEMILRDRNHTCITIWGLLNETPDGPVFQHAVKTLSLVRLLDDTRLVLLGSGRWDGKLNIGSISNPKSDKWEYLLGAEAQDVPDTQFGSILGYVEGAGDIHVYPEVPHSPETIRFLRTVGIDTKPVFLSEYGIGSLINAIRESRYYEQVGARPDLDDMVLMRSMAEKFIADWKRFKMDNVYAFPEDMLFDSQRLHARQRLLGFDLIRSNPKICGYNLTGMLDHGMTGEGLWTFWREWKPGIVDVLSDGWAPLRWCLFVKPLHGYSGRPLKFEAVLANEDVLKPGEYPVCFKIFGPNGVVWEKHVNAIIPDSANGEDGPLATPVLCEEVILTVPTGVYEFAANMEVGGAPAGGRIKFYVSDTANLPKAKKTITLWGIEKKVEDWLKLHGIQCRQFKKTSSTKREVILVGDLSDAPEDLAAWKNLIYSIARGSTVIFLSPLTLQRGAEVKVGRLVKKGNFNYVNYASSNNFEVKNMPENEREYFTKEFYGELYYLVSELPDGDYVVELGMCENFWTEEGKRIFDVLINDSPVLQKFDIVKEAGGAYLSVVRRFKIKPRDGKIEIKSLSHRDNPSLSILRIYDNKNQLIIEDSVSEYLEGRLAWLPLKKKGKCYEFFDWLYHKECVAKLHPIFDGLQSKGIMDWDYYGPVIPHCIFDGQETPDEVIVSAFAVGYSCSGGYASGVLVGCYNFKAGKFIINTLKILENIDVHPAADRLLLNMINYASGDVDKPLTEKYVK